MSFLKGFARGELHLTRIEAFSDGVLAIIVTALVPELKVSSLHNHRCVGEPGPRTPGSMFTRHFCSTL